MQGWSRNTAVLSQKATEYEQRLQLLQAQRDTSLAAKEGVSCARIRELEDEAAHAQDVVASLEQQLSAFQDLPPVPLNPDLFHGCAGRLTGKAQMDGHRERIRRRLL